MRGTPRIPGLLALCFFASFAAGCSDDEGTTPLPHAEDDAGVPKDGGGTGAAGGAGGQGGSVVASSTTASTGGKQPGVLIDVAMKSRVAVLMEAVPEGIRDRVADAVLAQPASFWEARARAQIGLTSSYGYYHEKFMPLPPSEKWTITLDAAGAMRTTEDGHDVVSIVFDFTSTLLTDPFSPIETKPPLLDVGDKVKYTVGLPIDPEVVYQRIAESCLDNDGVLLPFSACPKAVGDAIGRVDTQLVYERVDWDAAKADAVRVGEVTNPDGADLSVRAQGLDHNRLIYRYIPDDDCSIAEKCVGGPGWRRLLQFTATVHNQGGKALHIGEIDGSDWVGHHIFSYSPCHDHYHFLHYGDFSLGPNIGDKRAFCLISTGRYSNNETTSVVTDYEYCDFQGIASGWGDDYGIGLDCQWIDVTDVDVSAGPVTLPLKFVSNSDQFLCEGKPVVDGSGDQVFESTMFKDEAGHTIDRPKCDFPAGWDANNTGTKDVTIPVDGGYVTAACGGMPLGARRDCGFTKQDNSLACTPDTPVQLTCSVADPTLPQAIRICETSAVLGTGVSCTYFGSLTSTVVEGPTTLSFTCPGPRDATEPGGNFSIYTAPAYPGDPGQVVTCASM